MRNRLSGLSKSKIAFVGLKGIPCKCGGIEKYVEEIGKRLVQRGYHVTVLGAKWYCGDYNGNDYLGVSIKKLPTIHLQSTDALTNGLLAAFGVAIGDYDIVHFHGYASYYFIPMVQKFGKRTVVTAHGVESGWDNPKYNSFARRVLRRAFKIGVTHADVVTTVAAHLKFQIWDTYQVDAKVFPSGLDDVAHEPANLIRNKYGLEKLGYFLFLGRIDPIKRVDWVLDLLGVIPKGLKIAVCGGGQNPSTEAYLQDLKNRCAGDPRIVFTGPVFGKEKAELLGNCLAIVAPSAYEGLPITLLEAFSYGRCCIASDIPAHQEVIEDKKTGLLFRSDDKAGFLKAVKNVTEMPKESIESIGIQAQSRGKEKFNWETTVDGYDQLYRSLVNGKG